MNEGEALSLLLYAAGAFLMPILGGILGIPAAVAEMLFGILIGNGVLRLPGEHAFLSFLSQFGFAYLMFLAGMELDFDFLKTQGGRGLLRGGAVVASIWVFGQGLCQALNLPGFYLLVFGALSIGVLVTLLQEWNLARDPWGQGLLLAGSLGEFCTILILTLYHILLQKGLGWPLVWEGGKLLLVLLAGLMFLKTLQLVVWWFPERFHRLVRPWDPSELGVRAGFLVMMGFVAGSVLLHVEFILGAFVAGITFSYVFRERGILQVKLAGAGYGFFIPVFFIHVGVSLDPAVLWNPEALRLAGLLFLGVLACKFPAAVSMAAMKHPLRRSLAAPFLLASPLTLLVAVAALGLDLGAIDKREESAVVFVALASAFLYPVIAHLLLGRPSRAAPPSS
jgi:Kef-type K+ transport system membrane component KefB